MGTDTIPVRSDGQTIQSTHPNLLRTVLIGDLVPRNASGIATDEAGNLGTSTLAWLKAFIASGYFSVGDIKAHHTFNGTAPIGHGWMLCDGRVVSEANYNTEHGAGTWATYIGSSPIDSLNLPDLTGKFLVGAASTTQDGTVAITYTGNASNQVNLQHTHTGPAHVHKIYEFQGGANDQSYDVTGNAQTLPTGGIKAGGQAHIEYSTAATNAPDDMYTTEAGTGNTGNGLSTTQSIQPHSLQVVYYMRII